MAMFGVKTEKSTEAREFFSETKYRLSSNNLVKNPFTGGIKKFGETYVVDMQPIYTNFTPYVLFFGVGLTVVFGFSWWYAPFFVIGGLGIFWTKYYLFFMLKKGLKHKGYKGKITLLSPSKIIREVMFEWDNKKSLSSLRSEESLEKTGSPLPKSVKA